MKRNYFNNSSEIGLNAYIGTDNDNIFLEQNEPILNAGHNSIIPPFFAHDDHFRNSSHSNNPYVNFKCFTYNSYNKWEQKYPVNFYNANTQLNLVKRGTAFIDCVPHRYEAAGDYYLYWSKSENLGSDIETHTYQYYEIYNSGTKSSSTKIGGFYAESDRVCVIMQAGGGGGGAPTSGKDGAAGGGGGCAVFLLNIGLIRDDTTRCFYFKIGTGGAPSGGGWGSKGSDGDFSACYYCPTGTTGAPPVEIAEAEGGKGGGDNTAGTGGYGFLTSTAINNGYCWKMPGISYSGTNYQHWKGGNGGIMGNAGSRTSYKAYATYSPQGSPIGFYYECSGTGGTSKSNAGGGGGAGAYPGSHGGNGGAVDWATGDAGTLGGGGGGCRYQWGDGGKGGKGGDGALIITEACVPPICNYDGDSTPDIQITNKNSQQAAVWINDAESNITIGAGISRWVSVQNFDNYYNIRLVLGNSFSSQSIRAYSGTDEGA